MMRKLMVTLFYLTLATPAFAYRHYSGRHCIMYEGKKICTVGFECPPYESVHPENVDVNACGYWASELIAELFYGLYPENHIDANQKGSTTKEGERCWLLLMRECGVDPRNERYIPPPKEPD